MNIDKAVYTIYKVINSGIIDSELEDELRDICWCLENDEWDDDVEVDEDD